MPQLLDLDAIRKADARRLKAIAKAKLEAVPSDLVDELAVREASREWSEGLAAAAIDIDFDPDSPVDGLDAEACRRLRDDLEHLDPASVLWHLPRSASGRVPRDLWLTLDVLGRRPHPHNQDISLVLMTAKIGADRSRLCLSVQKLMGTRPYSWHLDRALWDRRHRGRGLTDTVQLAELPFLGRPDRSMDERLDQWHRGSAGPVDRAELTILLADHGELETACAVAGLRWEPVVLQMATTPGVVELTASDFRGCGGERLSRWNWDRKATARFAFDVHDLALSSLAAHTETWAATQRPKFRFACLLPAPSIRDNQASSAHLVAEPTADGVVLGIRRVATTRPKLPASRSRRLVEIDLLRTGQLGLVDLPPTVRSGLGLPEPAAGEAPTVRTKHRAERSLSDLLVCEVECYGEKHRLAMVDGAIAFEDHDTADEETERVLGALGGPAFGCFKVRDSWHSGTSAGLPARWKELRRRLQRAIDDGDSAALTVMLDAGIDPRTSDRSGRSLLSLVSRFDVAVAERLLDVDDIDSTDRAGRTPLHAAAAAGNVDVMARLLERGSDPQALDQSAKRPFDLAVENGHVEAMRLLLDVVERPFGPDYRQLTIEQHARLSNEASVHISTSTRSWRLACEQRDLDLLTKLGRAGMNTDGLHIDIDPFWPDPVFREEVRSLLASGALPPPVPANPWRR